MNYSEIKSLIEDWTNRNDLTAYIGTWINLVQWKLERGVPVSGIVIPNQGKWNCMKVYATGTLTASSKHLTYPTRYRETRYFWIVVSGVYYPVDKKTLDYVLRYYPTDEFDPTTGQPVLFASDDFNGRFVFGPTPDSAYSYEHEYYAYHTDLSDSNTSNWWTENAWPVLLYGALCEAEPFIKNDERISLWKAEFASALNGLAMTEINAEFSGHQAIYGETVV